MGEEKRDRENGDGELGRIKGNWAGPKERKERERFLFLKKRIQTIQFKFKCKRI
jgi:hypothetical protein